jgi:DNA-directed RNA polymerase subunit RPC12/RpoP
MEENKEDEERNLGHAKWIHYNPNMYEDVECSNCKFETYVDEEIIGYMRYCPYCGARMDKK